jgi:hypothetical protein
MTIGSGYEALWAQLHALREAALDLRVTAREDVPRDGGAMPAERIADRVDDAIGALEEAVAAAALLVDETPRARDAATGMRRVGERLAETSRVYWRDVAGHHRQAELAALARRRGPEWTAWLVGVRDALAPIPDLLEAAHAAWRNAALELLDRADQATEHRMTVPGGARAQAHEGERN